MLDYQFLLNKRICDIEDVIDHHFALIKSLMVEKLEQKLKSESEKLNIDGQQLTFA